MVFSLFRWTKSLSKATQRPADDNAKTGEEKQMENGSSSDSASWLDLIDLYFKLCGTNMLHKKQIIHKIYNEMTAGGKRGSSNVNKMFCALEC